MIKSRGNHFLTVCLLCFIFSLFSNPLLAEKNPQKKLQLIKQELTKISRDLKKKQTTKNTQIKTIEAFDKEISILRKDIRKTTSIKRSTKKDIKALRQQSATLNQNIEINRKKLAEMTVAIYQRGDENYLKILLNHNDAAEQSRMLTYYEYFYQAFTERHNKLSLDLAELETIDKALDLKVEDLDRVLTKLKSDTEALKLQRKDKKAYLVKLNSEIKNKEQQLAVLNESRGALRKLLKALKKRKHREARERKAGMSFAKNKGRLKWPVAGSVRQKYGQRRGKSGLKWDGVLISAKLGEKVRAVDAGTVVFADWLSGYGYVLIIEHGKGYMSLYGHNQQLLKETGDKINVNDAVAEAGNSGRLTTPGLYFEIRKNGKPVNPGKWMRARAGR